MKNSSLLLTFDQLLADSWLTVGQLSVNHYLIVSQQVFQRVILSNDHYLKPLDVSIKLPECKGPSLLFAHECAINWYSIPNCSHNRLSFQLLKASFCGELFSEKLLVYKELDVLHWCSTVSLRNCYAFPFLLHISLGATCRSFKWALVFIFIYWRWGGFKCYWRLNLQKAHFKMC